MFGGGNRGTGLLEWHGERAAGLCPATSGRSRDAGWLRRFVVGRYDIQRRIEKLDAIKDHVEIYHLLVCYEFPWDYVRSLEVALYRTYCVPSISTLLDRTGELVYRSQKRYDDTAILIADWSAHGYDSERGRAAIRRMNRIHHHFNITNEDYLYVLTTFVCDPIRWNARFGWRKLTNQERLASFTFWREVGRRMNIKNLPETYDELERYNVQYEQTHFAYADTNRRVGEATRDLFLSWFPMPGFLRPGLRPAIYALLDDSMLRAFGFPRPPRVFRQLVAAGLQARALVLRVLPPRSTPYLYADGRHRAYPAGYTLADLGPTRLLESLNGAADAATDQL